MLTAAEMAPLLGGRPPRVEILNRHGLIRAMLTTARRIACTSTPAPTRHGSNERQALEKRVRPLGPSPCFEEVQCEAKSWTADNGAAVQICIMPYSRMNSLKSAPR